MPAGVPVCTANLMARSNICVVRTVKPGVVIFVSMQRKNTSAYSFFEMPSPARIPYAEHLGRQRKP